MKLKSVVTSKFLFVFCLLQILATTKSLADAETRNASNKRKYCGLLFSTLPREANYQHISSKFKNGQLQEAAWEFAALERPLLARRILENLEKKLKSGRVISISSIPDGTTGAKLVKLDNGALGVFKTQAGANNTVNAEIAAYRLSELLGLDLVPMTIQREINGQTGSFQYFLKEAHHDLDGKRNNNMVFFDYLIDIVDRFDSGRNWLVYGDSRQVAIDHGFAFYSDRFYEPLDEIKRLIPSQEIQQRLRKVSDQEIFRALGELLPRQKIDLIIRRKQFLLHLFNADINANAVREIRNAHQ